MKWVAWVGASIVRAATPDDAASREKAKRMMDLVDENLGLSKAMRELEARARRAPSDAPSHFGFDGRGEERCNPNA